MGHAVADSRSNAPRLLLISSEFPPGPGGIGTHAYQLARHLTRLGWQVHALSPQAYASEADRAAFNAGLPFRLTVLPDRDAGGRWWVRRMRIVRAALRETNPDLILATGRRSLWVAAAIHALGRRPWAAVGHGTEFLGESRAARWTRRAIGSAAAVVAVSEYSAGLIRGFAAPRRLDVIPNAADGDRFRPGISTTALRRSWNIGEGPVLLTVGQVGERKAQDVVIRALPRILAARPDTVYVMAGLPRREAEFAALAAEVGVAGQVRFTGVVPEETLPVAYNLADLFVLVSRTAGGDVEGFGIVVQEAALCGVPAVVSQGCGLTEAIREGETGLSVPPDDPEATAAAVLALLANEPRRREMGRQAREQALAATWAERVAEYDRVLRALLPPR